MAETVPANKWQECSCKKCGQKITDPSQVHFFTDTDTGGLGAVHKVCPPAHEAAQHQKSPDYMQGWNDAMAYAAKAMTELELPLLKAKE